jgi:hypothetical protein
MNGQLRAGARAPAMTAGTVLALALAACASQAAAQVQAQPKTVAGATCGVQRDASAAELGGNATDPATGRKFFLEFPCDLAPGEDVTFVLNIHGAGSRSGWQRQYFPASDYVERYRLVVATPTAATAEPVRRWTPEADDAHLRSITTVVTEAFGRENIRAVWLAGHSQGGATSHRIVCDDFFGSRVDGLLSLAGGRIGMRPEKAACEFSHIFTTGDQDSAGREGIPSTSPLAETFGCKERVRQAIIEDKQPGKVFDSRTAETGRPSRPGWGGQPGPGAADVFVFPECRDGRVVADVVRLNKGHTEGLEPRVTEELVRLMVSAPGGKLRAAATSAR